MARLTRLTMFSAITLAACASQRAAPDPDGASPSEAEAPVAPAGPNDQDDASGDDADRSDDALPGPEHVDLASWVQSGDDFIEGTVAEVRVAWTPMYIAAVVGAWYEGAPESCAEAKPAMDLVLSDLVSAHGNPVPETLTVRLGYLTWDMEGLSRPVAPVGQAAPGGWAPAQPAFSVGMRIGGPVYDVADHPDPIFPTGHAQPIYRIVDGAAQVAMLEHNDGDMLPEPELDALNGATPSALWQAVVAAAAQPNAPVASEYRDFILTAPAARPLVWWSSVCTRLHDSAPLDPCDGDTGDCG